MALLKVEYSSKSLEMATSFQVVLPDEGDLGQAKVVYLLHGLSDNCTGWTRYTSCERYARERGLALVIPEVQRSFYIDGVHGLPYFTYVSQELPQAVHRMFGLSLEREQNYVMGLSFITEGAIPFAAQDPLRVIPSCIIGSAIAGGLSMAFGCTLRAPHGGVFVLPTIGNPFMYLAAVVVGAAAGCVILGMLKKNAEE